MIKKLQRKFIMIAMFSILIVIVGIEGMINIINVARQNSETNYILTIIAENDGIFPHFKFNENDTSNNTNELTANTGNITNNENAIISNVTINTNQILENSYLKVTPETEHTLRYYSIKIDGNDNILSYNLEHITAITSEDVEEIKTKILENKKAKGFYDGYKYLIEQKDGYSIIVCLDFKNYQKNISELAFYSIMTGIIGYILVFVLVSFFSRKVIEPSIENEKRQREFITNAGHELKTPVAIILANADVLEMKNGQNDEWVQSIKNQANRLDVLIKRLLKLSKMSENGIIPNFEEVNVSEIASKVIDSIKIISKNNIIEKDIGENIIIEADEESLYELISILIDNAIKYVSKNGLIKIKIEKFSKTIKIDISNDCKKMTKQECDSLFERFYRADESRNRTNNKGGYGIGLSMASSIVNIHKGKISANYENGAIHFVVILNKKLKGIDKIIKSETDQNK